MAKLLQGKVISIKMQNTAIVNVTRFVAHPLYKKLQKKSKRYKVETFGQKLALGQEVELVETKPISKDKHFAILKQEKLKEPESNPSPEISKKTRIKKIKK